MEIEIIVIIAVIKAEIAIEPNIVNNNQVSWNIQPNPFSAAHQRGRTIYVNHITTTHIKD